ncbi:MAG: hypothetical protein ACTTJ4_00115 [Treponema sp.]|uniref:hypothetical protein n=1 Tax=Treponema sp. TaxID=166 RepID=UPI003FA1CF59
MNKAFSDLLKTGFIAVCVIFISITEIACTQSASSMVLYLPSDSAPIRLKALNKNAQQGLISKPEKNAQLLYGFEKSPDFYVFTHTGRYALELEFELLQEHAQDSARTAHPAQETGSLKSAAAADTEVPSAQFTVGFLYEEHFTASGALKKDASPRYQLVVQELPEQHLTVSLGFTGTQRQSAAVYGFAVQAAVPLKLLRAAVVPAQYGWLKTGSTHWFGVSADGGIIPPGITGTGDNSFAAFSTELPRPSHIARLAPIATAKTQAAGYLPPAASPAAVQPGASSTSAVHISQSPADARLQPEYDQLILHFDPSRTLHRRVEQESESDQPQSVSRQPQLFFQCGNQQVSVFMAPHLTRLTLDGSLFPDSAFSVQQLDTEPGLIGVTARCVSIHPLSPIPADAGLIVHWPQEHWRQPAYELFSWESFPSVLIFDFADYAAQDAYLKRLAFFADKKGYAGSLISDARMKAFHGFNAHDYRAETLAAFFQKAAQEQFPLNDSELHLQTILLHNGIIRKTEQGIEAGEGAILSISRQIPAYLRLRLLTHECLHGIYFTQEGFRNIVADVFEHTDPRSRLFLRRYFEADPRLNYNTSDSYLLQNEYMAYILQQSPSYLQEYYLTRLARHWAIRAAEPELCKYITATNAEAFVQVAEEMSRFLYAHWGIKGGRIYLAELKRF